MSWKIQCKQEAKKLSQEKRQEFLDYMFESKTIGEAMELCGVTFNQANGILMLNLNEKVEISLNRESV